MDSIDNDTSRRRKRFLALIIIIGAVLVYYSVMSMLGPGQAMVLLEEKYGVKEAENKRTDPLYRTDSAYVQMIKEKAFLQARIAMAETDSVSLSLNLADSTANLEINGVTVHSAQMASIRLSRILSSDKDNLITNMLSVPCNIANDYATIKKEPLMIKMAPKDTSEYKPDITPDTSDYEPVSYILEMETGLRLYICQEEKEVTSDQRHLLMFDLSDRLRYTWASLKSVAVLKVPEYHPWIRISLPKADAKIIYRAIPRKGQVAIYI